VQIRRTVDKIVGIGRSSAKSAPTSSITSFVRTLVEHAGLERTLLAAAEDLHARLAAYDERPDYPPIYAV
jgi:hypothetical protein